MDIDGRLEMITSPLPLKIERGDWVVVAGRSNHEANLFYNESRPSGNRRERYQATAWVLSALGALAALVGVAIICFALSRAVQRHWDLPFIVRYTALILAGVLTSWVGLWFATMMGRMAQLARAFDEVLRNRATDGT
jgi:hypothetical protein